MKYMKAPFPYFGGKSRIADEVWKRLGDVKNYVEPFCGSMAMLFKRPTEPKIETVNDIDGLLVNFWRAVKADPNEVAKYAAWPVTELDLHARHKWLIGERERIEEALRSDPDWFDAKSAGWWVWGISSWIGSGFGFKESTKIVGLGDNGRGVNSEFGRPHLVPWLQALSDRLIRTRICCGSWSRVLTPAVTTRHGLTGVFLDPPYNADGHDKGMYVSYGSVADEVREWAVQNGDNPNFRIALCGYDGEHEMPDSWEVLAWKAVGGYGKRNGNEHRERIWFSPHCLKPEAKQEPLFTTEVAS